MKTSAKNFVAVTYHFAAFIDGSGAEALVQANGYTWACHYLGGEPLVTCRTGHSSNVPSKALIKAVEQYWACIIATMGESWIEKTKDFYSKDSV